jgi:hypothetical protein
MFSTQHIIKEVLKYLEYQLQICTALTDPLFLVYVNENFN